MQRCFAHEQECTHPNFVFVFFLTILMSAFSHDLAILIKSFTTLSFLFKQSLLKPLVYDLLATTATQ